MAERSQFSHYNIAIAILFAFIILVFEITPNTNLVANVITYKLKNGHIVTVYQKPQNQGLNVAVSNLPFLSRVSYSASDNNKKEKLVHSSFRLKEDVLRSLETEARKRGVSLSTIVNRTLENYITSEMYFEELGFILVSKDFLRKAFSGLNEQDAQELGRELGLTVAKEYISFFFPEVNGNNLVKFLDFWFKRFQSYQHRIDNSRHHYIVNHEINMNFSIALKAMLEGLIEPIFKNSVNVKDFTSRIIAFSFDDH